MATGSIDITKSLAAIPKEPTEMVREWPLIRGHFAEFFVAYNLGELDIAIPPELAPDQHEDWMLGRSVAIALDGLRSAQRLADVCVPMEAYRG